MRGSGGARHAVCVGAVPRPSRRAVSPDRRYSALPRRSWSTPIPATCCIRQADALRHPASLTKIMTLYLLFEQLEAGRSSSTPRWKSPPMPRARRRPSSACGPARPMVEDAIKALVTKSANDAAVVIAEALAGDEDEFARLMTRKARALGMSPHRLQECVRPAGRRAGHHRARSGAARTVRSRTASRAITAISRPQSFTYRGVRWRNHNRLLGRVEGVDGIKTGYTRDVRLQSGQLRCSAATAVSSPSCSAALAAGARDAKMRTLIEQTVVAARR